MNNRHISYVGRPTSVPTYIHMPNAQMGVFFDPYGRSFQPGVMPLVVTPEFNQNLVSGGPRMYPEQFVIPTVTPMSQSHNNNNKSNGDHFSAQQPGAYPRKEAPPFVPSVIAKPFVPGGAAAEMRQPLGRHQTYSSSAVTGRERKIIPIIDPTTGEEIITGSEHQRLNSTGDSAIEISADLSSSDLSTSAVSKSNVDENNSAAHQAALDQHKSEVLMEFHRKIAGVALEKTSPTSGKQPTPSNQPTTVEAVAEVETVPLQVNGGLSAPEERAVSAKSRVVGVAVKILRRDMELTKPPPTLEVEIPVELAIVAEDNKQYSGESKSPDAQQSETDAIETVQKKEDNSQKIFDDIKKSLETEVPQLEEVCQSTLDQSVPEATESASCDDPDDLSAVTTEKANDYEVELEIPTVELVKEKPAYLDAFEQLKKLRETEKIFNPETREGQKVYSRECVNLIAKLPESIKEPQWTKKNELPEELFAERKSIPQQLPNYRFNLNQIKEDKFFPNFFPPNNGGGGGNDQQQFRRPYAPQTKPYGGRGSFENRQPKKAPIVLRPSLNQNVQLRTAEHAWKPASKEKEAVEGDSDEAKTKALFKKVRGILNRITPQTFQDLVDEFLALEISEETVLRGVIDIFFDKAVEEPSYCALYGQLCHKVRTNEMSKDKQSDFAKFLLNKCQIEFEREKRFETIQKDKEDEIAATEAPEKRKELEDALQELLGKEKRRTLGTIRFIGELYQHGMLIGKIMCSCIHRLMNSQGDEEAVECLCKLLTTIGKKFEGDPLMQPFMSVIFPKFKMLSEVMSLSSRIRFLVQDVVDLRNNGWESLRKNTQAGPMRLDELHNEIKMEKLQEVIDLQEYDAKKQASPGGQRGNRAFYQGRRSTGNQDVRYNQDGGGLSPRGDFAQRPPNYPKGGRNSANESVGKVSQGGRRDSNQNDLGAEKVKQANLSQFNRDVVLRPGGGSWGKSPKIATPVPNVTTNRFSSIADAPENSTTDEMRPHGAEGLKHSVSCAVFHSRESVSPLPSPEPRSTGSIMKKPSDTLSEEKLELYTRNLLDEVVNSKLLEEGIRLAMERRNQLKNLVVFAFNHAIDSTNPSHRIYLGQLLGSLIKNQGCFNDILSGFADFVDTSETNEVQLDCPEIWSYVGTVLSEVCSHTDPAILGRFLLKMSPEQAKDSVKELLRSSSSEPLQVFEIQLLNGLATSLKDSDLSVGNLWDLFRCLHISGSLPRETFLKWRQESGEKFEFSVVFESSQAVDFYGGQS